MQTVHDQIARRGEWVGGRDLAVAAVLTAFNFFGSIARFGLPHLSLERVTWNSVLVTSLLIGFIEEVPYGTAAAAFVFGLVMAMAFRYSKTLWAPILTHSANDCLSFVIFGL
jgi:CAAX protease family protein